MTEETKGIPMVPTMTASLRWVMEASPLGILVFGRDTRVLHANNLAERLFGKRVPSSGGIACGDFVSCIHRHAALKVRGHSTICSTCPLCGAIQATLAGNDDPALTTGEVHINRETGCRPIWIKFKARGADWDGRRAVVVAVDDITEHKRAEAALLESERRYHTILESIADGFFETDLAGKLTFFNDAVCELLGYSREAVKGMNYRQYTDEANAVDLFHVFNEVYRTGIPKKGYAWEIIRKDKTRRFVEVSVSLVKDAKGQLQGFRGIVRDVTERKLAERKLRESEERYRTILEAAPDSITITRVVDGRYLEVNKAFCELTGYSREEALGRTPADLNLFVDAADRMRFVSIMKEKGEVIDFDIQYRMRDGTVCDTILSAKPLRYKNEDCLVAIVTNISDRKRAEESVARQTTLFRNLFESSPEAIAVLDHEDRVLEINHAFESLFDYSIEEARGREINALLAPAPYLEDARSVSRAVLSSGRIVEKEAIRCARGGRPIDVSLMGYPINVGGRQIGAFGIYRDITERKRASEERERLQAQLNQAQKMESIGRLAGGVAHDFNNMLGVILGHADLIMALVGPDQSIYPSLTEIRNAAQRSANLTRQLLGFARKQTVAPIVMDLNQTVEGMLKMLRRMIGEDIDLEWRPGTHLHLIKMDPSQIDQILANLCVNAQDAITGPGKIIIETGTAVLDQAYCQAHEGFQPGEYVVLAVSDDGCGISPEARMHLFEPFFTTKEVGKGTGLGLATVYGIVKQNNGFINVYSEAGRGTTIKIYLHRHPEGNGNVRLKATMTTPKGRGELLLLLEDEPALLEMGKTMLEQLGYRVLDANTPRNAIELAESHSGHIVLLITDVVMPEMNGWELANQMKRQYPDLKTLFMSGYSESMITHREVLGENVQFIQKPFSMHDLGLKVRSVIDAP